MFSVLCTLKVIRDHCVEQNEQNDNIVFLAIVCDGCAETIKCVFASRL